MAEKVQCSQEGSREEAALDLGIWTLEGREEVSQGGDPELSPR